MIKFYSSGNGYRKNRVYGFEHRFVWMLNHGKIPEGYVIHHKNGDKLDNRIENLECVKDSEHRQLHGRRNPKLPQEVIAKIKVMRRSGAPISQICKLLKIANATVWDYVHGNKRKHIRKNYD